jgi:hypothetical protein
VSRSVAVGQDAASTEGEEKLQSGFETLETSFATNALMGRVDISKKGVFAALNHENLGLQLR